MRGGESGKRLSALLLLFLLSIPAAADGDGEPGDAEALARADALDTQVVALYMEGRHAEALPVARESLAIVEEILGPEHERTATCLQNIGAQLRSLADDRSARACFERALKIREELLDPENLYIAAALDEVGMILHALGDPRSGKPHLVRALAIREKALGPEHEETIRSINNLGHLLRAIRASGGSSVVARDVWRSLRRGRPCWHSSSRR